MLFAIAFTGGACSIDESYRYPYHDLSFALTPHDSINNLSQARVSREPYEAHAFSHSFTDSGLVGYCAGMWTDMGLR